MFQRHILIVSIILLVYSKLFATHTHTLSPFHPESHFAADIFYALLMQSLYNILCMCVCVRLIQICWIPLNSFSLCTIPNNRCRRFFSYPFSVFLFSSFLLSLGLSLSIINELACMQGASCYRNSALHSFRSKIWIERKLIAKTSINALRAHFERWSHNLVHVKTGHGSIEWMQGAHSHTHTHIDREKKKDEEGKIR